MVGGLVALIEDFEKKEKELLKAHKDKLKCQGGDGGPCEGKFISKGRAGNASVSGLRRVQIKCNKCSTSIALHLALMKSEDKEMMKDANVLQEMYEKATGCKRTAQDKEKKVIEESAGPAVEEEESEYSSATDDEAKEDVEIGRKASVKVGRPSTKRSFVQTPMAARQGARKVYVAAPSAMKRGVGCGKECQVKIAELSAHVREQSEVMASMKKMLDEQNVVISELTSLVRSLKHEDARRTNSSTVKNTPRQEMKVGAPEPAAKTSCSNTADEKPSHACAEKAQRPHSNESAPLPEGKETKVPSFVEVTRRYIPAKEFRELKRCAVPFKAPVRVVKLHFRFSWPRKETARAEVFILARNMLEAAKVGKDVILDVSFIGRSILEVYVAEENASSVKGAMRKWCEGVDTFVPESEIDNFPQGKLKADDILTKKVSRATFLCARNRSQAMQDCILRDIDQALHAKILKEAEVIKQQWAPSADTAEAAKEAQPEESKGGNQC